MGKKTIFHIFDVEHGACNIIQTPNNKLIMIDCGHNASTGWTPSNWIISNDLSITNLTISNIDEDHLSDLENVEKFCSPETFTTNGKLNLDWIENRKEELGGLGKGVEKLIFLLRNKYIGGSINIDYELERKRFYHSNSDFDDFNNLSVVSFFYYSGIGIIFPGDLEKKGWEKFLNNNSFRNCLNRTNIFIASHHGRISGYCEKVFDLCHPYIVIISDKSIKFNTQDHHYYNQHATGVQFEDSLRKVLTTRKDGKITITINSNGNSIISTSS